MNPYKDLNDKELNQRLKDVNKAVELFGPNSKEYPSLLRTQHKLRIEAMNRAGNESTMITRGRFPNY